MQHRLAILASGSGSNARKMLEFFADHPSVKVDLIGTNRADAGVLQHARDFDVETLVFDRETLRNTLAPTLVDRGITHVVLAGFLWMIPEALLEAYPDRMVNIHPSLLPKYGGKGMYGMHVHRAVKQAGEVKSGITIHLVNARYDEGQILFQASTPVALEDTPEDIQQAVQVLEHFCSCVAAWACIFSASLALQSDAMSRPRSSRPRWSCLP